MMDHRLDYCTLVINYAKLSVTYSVVITLTVKIPAREDYSMQGNITICPDYVMRVIPSQQQAQIGSRVPETARKGSESTDY